MTDPRSLLGDILAATSQATSVPAPAAAVPAPKPAPIPAAPRHTLGDLLRLDDDAWRRWLGGIAPDDLVVLCATCDTAWRERVLIVLDQESRNWMRANLASLGDVAPALRDEVQGRVLDHAHHLLRTGAITLPATQPAVAAERPAEPAAAPPARPAPARDAIQVSFVPPGAPQPAAPVPAAAAADRPAIGRVSMSFGDMPSPSPAAPPPADDGLDALFADLMRLRQQAGVAALLPLAAEVPEPFLKEGLGLVATGLSAAELERALDGALARQVEVYLDHLTGMRARLLALARGDQP